MTDREKHRQTLITRYKNLEHFNITTMSQEEWVDWQMEEYDATHHDSTDAYDRAMQGL